MAKIWEAQRQGAKALQLYEKLAFEVGNDREDLDQDLYRKISGEANFRLAESLQKEAEDAGEDAARTNFKGSRLEASLTFYNKAIDSEDPEWGSRARFQAAALAESISHNIRKTLAKGANRADPNLLEQSKRWLQVSQQYHTQNLMARQKDPYKFKDVVWVERSALKASGLQPQVEPASRNLPSAFDTAQPYQWSH